MATPGLPPRPTTRSQGPEPLDLRRQRGPYPSRISAQIRYRHTANSQVSDLHTLPIAKGVTSQVVWYRAVSQA